MAISNFVPGGIPLWLLNQMRLPSQRVILVVVVERGMEVERQWREKEKGREADTIGIETAVIQGSNNIMGVNREKELMVGDTNDLVEDLNPIQVYVEEVLRILAVVLPDVDLVMMMMTQRMEETVLPFPLVLVQRKVVVHQAVLMIPIGLIPMGARPEQVRLRPCCSVGGATKTDRSRHSDQ